MTVTNDDRLRYSDLRAMLTQGKSIPEAEVEWMKKVRPFIKRVSAAGLTRFCQQKRFK